MNKRACVTRSNVGSGSRSIVKFYLKPKKYRNYMYYNTVHTVAAIM